MSVLARTGVAALVIDDVLPPWRPRGIEIRGRGQAREDHPQSIRIYPRRVTSWGLVPGQNLGARDARDIS